MTATKYEPKQRPQDHGSFIHVVPTAPKHAMQISELTCRTYGFPIEDSYTVDEVLSQIKHFPEGQFVAADTRTDKVVGYTMSMRLDYNPEYPLLESWVETTNYG
jgi:hypothetical protein